MGKKKENGFLSAHVEMDDEYEVEEEEEVMDVYGLQLNSNGEVIEYDVLTGDIYGFDVNKYNYAIDHNRDRDDVLTDPETAEMVGLYLGGLMFIGCCLLFLFS